MERISASERTREELRALIDGRLGTAASRSDLVRLAVRLIVEETLDAEATEAVGRERYERAAGGASGYRNGYRTGKLKTAEGMVDYAAPQVRETPEPFTSAIRKALAGRTEALEDLAVELYARGLSTRDIEDAFTDETGRRLLSRAAVSEVTERLWEEYEAFSRRDLSEHRIVYLYVDGIAAMSNPYLKPGRLPDVIAAITAMASYKFYKLDFDGWANRISGPGKAAEHWKQDMMSTYFKGRGGAGMVIDGCLRDYPNLKRLDLPLWIRGWTPNFHTQTGLMPFAVNVPIACGGVTVIPGDIIIADDDGAVVLPVALAAKVIEESRVHHEWEEFSRMKLLQGAPLQRYYPLHEDARGEYEEWRASNPAT